MAAIGPAGRNQVVWACILNGSSDAAGRTGMGAVMGSKNIWAIAARGTQPIQVHDPEKLLEVVNKQYTQVTSTKGFLATSMYGTLIRLNNTRTQGYEGGHNHQFNMMEQGGEELDADIFLDKYESAKTSCFNCPVHCRHHYEIKEGPFKGTKGGSMEYYGAGGWGSQCGSGDWNTILVGFARCNEYGLDVGSATAYTAWLMELWEKGILTSAHRISISPGATRQPSSISSNKRPSARDSGLTWQTGGRPPPPTWGTTPSVTLTTSRG